MKGTWDIGEKSPCINATLHKKWMYTDRHKHTHRHAFTQTQAHKHTHTHTHCKHITV
jgi:hypothetical protein